MSIPSEFGIPSPVGELETEFMFEDALDTLGDSRAGSVDLENALVTVRGLKLKPDQSKKFLEVASGSIDQWCIKVKAPGVIGTTLLPHLITDNDTQTETVPSDTKLKVLGRLLAVKPGLYDDGFRAAIIKGAFGPSEKALSGLLTLITTEEYIREHDLDPVAGDYVDLIKTVLNDAKVKSQRNDEFVKEAQAVMSTEVLGAITLTEMQKPIPEREQLTAQAIIAMVTVDPDSFTEGVERRVLRGEYGDAEEILSGIIRSMSAKIRRSGYEGPDSPDSLTMAIIFDGLLTINSEKARQLIPEVVETPWYWDREHSFSYGVLQALDVAGVPVGEEEEFVREHARAIEGSFDPRLDQKELAQISNDGTFAQRFASVMRTIRQNEGFFRQITFDINTFEDSEEYPYFPDNVLVAAIRNPEGFAQLPALEAVAPELTKRLKNPKPLEERNSGMIRDMLATEHPLETALKIQAKFARKKKSSSK